MRGTHRQGGLKQLRWAVVALGLILATAAQALSLDITSQFAITRTGFLLNRVTNTFDSTVTLTNTSGAPVLSPISAVVSGFPTTVTLANKTGVTPDGKPYVSPLSPGSVLQNGGTLTFVLKFANPQRVTITSVLQILYSVPDVPPDAPNLLSVVATGGTNALLIGRLDGAANRSITLQASTSPTCVAGTLVGETAVGAVTATTDGAGYFGVPVSGVVPGDFVAVKATSPTPSPMSVCLVSSRDNDSWPKAFTLEGSTLTARDFIDTAGRARWYKFPITPGQRIEVKLTGLPADYDLAVFKDIAQTFAKQFSPGAAAKTADLLRLTAEYAPSTFSPSTFSPSTFSPDAYSPSTFSPSTFSPSTFSPSTFSPSTFSPSTFSPSTFSPSTFSPSTFSPSTFSPSTFSPSVYTATEIAQAFSTAQTRSVIGVAATAGTGDESLVVNSWNSTGNFYVRVVGHGGAFNTSTPFTVTVTKGPTTCTGVTDTVLTPRSAVTASGLATVILTDSSKVALDVPLLGGTLRAKLSAFAARSEVKGVVVDVASDSRVAVLKQQAANNPACPFAKNLVAREIKGIVDAYRANPLQYVVIVGNDDAIPFFRSPDQSGLGQESGYVPPVQSNSTSEASLRLDFVLSQDGYGSTTQVALPFSDFPVPGLAVGRLVETATEIAGVLDAYVAANGVVVPGSSLVTGYDFLEDTAIAVRNELQLGIGTGVSDALITPNTLSPQANDPRVWTAADLRAKLFGARHDVIFLAGHFSANSALAADFTTSVLTTEVAASTVDLANSIVFSAGCHSGYNLVDVDSIPGVTQPLDWAQAFARKNATLIAGTGYQYGDTDFLEYSERLYNNFARQLRAGTAGTSIPIGAALVSAKLDYLATTPDIRGIHEKALLEATLFGLPMLGVNMPAGRGAPPGSEGAITPALVTAGPARSLGLTTFDLAVAPSLTPHTISLKNVKDGSSVIANWLSGPDGVITKPGEPALPLDAVNVTPTDPSLVLRGIGFRGGSYVDSAPLFPFSGAPTTELRGVHVPFVSPVFFPGRMWNPNYFGALAGSGGTQLLVTPAQHRVANLVDGTSTQRKFTDLNLRLYYSGDLSQAALSDAPSLVSVDAQPDAGGVLFGVQVTGNPAASIYQVWITYTSDGASAWTPLDLAQCVAPLPAACGTNEDSRLWKGRLASAPANLRYLVQAVNGVGLVALDDNRGTFYGIGGATPAATTSALVSPPTRATVGDTVNITTKVTIAGAPVAGKIVTVAIGGTTQLAMTGSDGSVTVKMPVAATPGTYPMTASFAGDDVFQPSSITSTFVIDKAVSTLAELAPTGVSLTGVLGGKTEALQQETVSFALTGPSGSTTASAITDYLGRAMLPPPGLPAGNYTVTAASFAGNAIYAPASITLAQQISVPKTNQSIAFDALAAKTTADPDFAVFATASSGLPATFAASGACTVAGGTVHITGIGSCAITATQNGDNNYNAAPQVQRSFAITAPGDTTAPTVVSLVRAAPSPTMADAVSYTLTFSEPVTGVASSNFAVVTSGITAASVATISGGGTTWSITVDTGQGTGSLHLDVVDGTGITDASGTPLAGTPVTGETYQIDKGGTVNGTGAGQPVAGFGSSGYALFSDVPTVVAPSAIAVLADGRILAAGAIGCNATSNLCALQLARYSATGVPEASFGTNGRLVTAVTNVSPELNAPIVNADGTFFVTGVRNNGTAFVPFAAKFTSAGAPVAAFGANGVALLDSLPVAITISGTAIDASGRIVIVATTPDAGAEREDILVARLTSTGAIDPTFGSGGVAQFAISTVDARSDRGTAVAVQPDGGIVVGGRTQVGAGALFDFLLLRLDANGAPDPTFGSGGIATTHFAGSTGSNLGRKLVLQPDGKIVLVGGVALSGTTIDRCGIARFNANGTLDGTFGVGGQVLEAVDGCFDVSLQTDGKPVIVANDQEGDIFFGTILRELATGAPDEGFGNSGFLDISSFGGPGRVAFTSSGNLVTSLVIQDPADGVLKSYVVELSGQAGPPPTNQPPIANAGPDQSVTAGTTVQLTGAGSSDPEGGALSYAWTFTSRPAGSAAAFNNSTFASPTFFADRKGTYEAQLIVTDGGTPPLASAPDTVQITATNRAPVAVADSYSVAQDATLNIAAAGVLANDSDADGDALSASLGTNVTHGALTLSADGGFVYTPSVGYSGPDAFTYRANDGASDSNTVTVSINVTSTPTNQPPVANAGTNQSAAVGQLVQLSGSCIDVDGDTTTRTWSFASRPAGSNASLSSTTILNPTFTPDLPGSYQPQLVCNDGHVDSAPSTVTITAASSTITLTLASPLAAVNGAVNGTITLSTAAPAGGVQVTLASSNTGFATVAPSPVTIAAGATTGAFTVTGVAVGSATITGSATGYAAGTVDIGVTANVIALGFVAMAPGQTQAFSVTLATPAPAGGVTIALTSGNTGVVTVPGSVVIPAGAIVPAANPVATGVASGLATITGTATGYASGSATATIAAPVQWTIASGGNNHWYQFIYSPSGFTWQQAWATASGNTFLGLPGYLATVTSQAENDFLFALAKYPAGATGTLFDPANPGVNRGPTPIAGRDAPTQLGGTDSATEGTWRWVNGPDTGAVFWTGDASGSSGGAFASWSGGQPDSFGGNQDSLQLVYPGGLWDDAGAGALRTLEGTNPDGTRITAGVAFIVEYSPATPPVTFTVTNSNDSGVGSLRDAIAQANLAPGPNTIVFAPGVTGTILLTSGQIAINGPLTIVGPGANNLAIDGNASGRIFAIFATDPACPALDGPDYLVSISGLRLTNGRRTQSQGAGAIFSEHSLALDSVIVDNSTAGNGGGITYLIQYPGQSLTIANAQFLDNMAQPLTANPGNSNGGALSVLERCAGTLTTPVAVSIANSVFSGNRSQPVALEGHGGAILISAHADVTITDTRIVDNHVDNPTPPVAGNNYNGGGLWARVKSLRIERSEISDNRADFGGGLRFNNDAPALQAPAAAMQVKIVNSTISGNAAGGGVNQSGGAIHVFGNVALELDNSTVSGNSAVAFTGGIVLSTGATDPVSASNATAPTLTLVSSILANNSGQGGDVGTSTSTIPAFAINANNSLIRTVCTGCNISVSGSGNLTNVDPLLAALAFNGGPTRTHALLAGSPAIDAGSNPLALATDQRGEGFLRTFGTAPDMGAFELAKVINLTLTSPLTGINQTVGGAVTLGTPAPAGGLQVTLASSNTNIASVAPSSVDIAAGQTTASFTVTGVAIGTATLTASGTGYADGTAQIGVTNNVITVGSLNMAPGQTQGFPVTLATPAPVGGSTVNLTSSNTAVVTVPASVFIAAGAITPASNPVATAVAFGTATITGTASGYAPGVGSVTVAISGTLTPNPRSVAAGGTSPVTLTLSEVAPAGGLTVNLSIDNTAFATVPATAFIQQGNLSVVFDVSGVAPGSTTLHASGGGLTATAATINVTSASTMTIGNDTVGKDLQVNHTLTLSAAAPPGNLVITLTSSDPAKVLLSSNATTAGSASIQVTVNAGITQASFYVQALSGTGTATITGSAPGYAPGTGTVTLEPSGFYISSPGDFSTNQLAANTNLSVCASSLNPTTLNRDFQSTTLRAGIAPVSVAMTSSNTATGTIVNTPQSIGGNTSCTASGATGLQFHPLAVGNSTLTLTTPSGFATTASFQSIVATVTAAGITVTPQVVGKDHQVSTTFTLGAPAPAGNLVVSLTSSDPTKLLLASDASTAGSTSTQVTVPAGQSSGTYFVQALASSGTPQVTAAAPNYANGTATVTLEPSGFYISSPGDFSTNQLAVNTNLSVCASSLNPTTLNRDFQSTTLRAGIASVSVAMTSSNTAVGTIVNTPQSIGGNASCTPSGTGGLQFDPLGAGTSTLTVTTPSGFTTTANFQSIVATVTAAGINVNGNNALGKDLQEASNGSLQAAAGSSGATVTLSSSDPSKLLIAPNATTPGSASINVTVQPNQTAFSYVLQSLASTGTVQVIASATGYANGTANVTLVPSGFYMSSPGDFSTNQLAANTNLSVCASSLNPTTLNRDLQSTTLRAGIASVSVAMTSSNTAAGVIVNTPQSIGGNASCTPSGTGGLQFDPLGAGTSTLTVTTPSGFTTTANFQSIVATVTAAGINVNGNNALGKDLQEASSGSLQAAAGSSGATVTLSSSDPSKLLIAPNATTPGSASINVTVQPNQTAFSYVLQSLASTGTVQIIASATGYADGTANVTLVPSGFYMSSPGDFSTNQLAPNTNLSVCASSLNPTTLNRDLQSTTLRAGIASVSVAMTSSNTAVGTIVNTPQSIGGNASCTPSGTGGLQFDPLTVGNSTLTVTTPSGFTTPSTFQSIVATVAAAGINVNGNNALGKDLQEASNGSLQAAAGSSGATVTLSSSDPSKLLIAPNATTPGSASINVTVQPSQTAFSYVLQSLASTGTVQVIASSTGYVDDSANVTLVPSGFYISSPGDFSTTTLAANTNLSVCASSLNPATLNRDLQSTTLRAGIASVSVAMTSSNTAVGTIVNTPQTLAGNTSCTTGGVNGLQFNPATVGTSDLTVATPSGFSTPSNFQAITATVN